MKFSTTLAALVTLFIGFGLANPVPAAEAAAVVVDNPLEPRACKANGSQ